MNDRGARPGRSRAVRVVGSGVIALVIGSALVVASEGWLRVGDQCYRSMMVHDPSVGWKLLPDVETMVRYRWSPDSVDFSFNAAGFRDRDHPRAKPSGVERILILGDSYTAGLEVPSDEIFTSRLARRLADGSSSAPPREVMNVAVGAWSTDQQWIELRDRGLAYAPDYVILMIAPNDVREAYAKGFFRSSNGQLEERRADPVPFPARVAWWLSNRSCAFQALQGVLGSSHGAPSKMFEFYPVHFPVGDGWSSDEALFLLDPPAEFVDAFRLFDRLVLEIVEACRSTGCRPLLAVVPTKVEFEGQLDPALHEPGRVAAHVRALSERHGIDYVDLFGPLEALDDPLLLFIEEEYHLTAEGHAYVADQLANWFDGG